jgi:3-oxoadipate enol-lactonase
MPIQSVNNVNLYYELHGQGSPLVLVSGFTADHHAWDAMLNALTQHHQVLVFDNRGSGQSDQPDSAYTLEDMASDAMGLADALDLGTVHIAGQSMGGAIAQTMARDFPQRVSKMVICDSFTKLSTISRVAFESISELYKLGADYPTVMRAIMAWANSSAFIDKHHDAIMDMLHKCAHPQTPVGYYRQLEAMLAFDSREWIGDINAETLIFAADEDIIAFSTESERMATQMPNARHFYVEYCGHSGPFEHPDLYADEMLRFLAL